jgi:hypothetical protein
MTRSAFARSKVKSMHPEIARNQNYDDHYANDSEVFIAPTPLRNYGTWRDGMSCLRPSTIGLLPPPAISIITTTSEK